MEITSDVVTLGRLVRRQRRRLQLRQSELAALAGVGTRFLSELENGKPSLEFDRVLRVLRTAGLELLIASRSWRTLFGPDAH